MQPDFSVCVALLCEQLELHTFSEQKRLEISLHSVVLHSSAHSVVAHGLKTCLCPHLLFNKSEKGIKPQAYIISCFAGVGQLIAFIERKQQENKGNLP